MKVIVNSSCLIVLSRIGKINLLRDVFGKILIPKGVFEEVVVEGKKKKGSEILDLAWIEIRDVGDALAVKILCSELGRGESEVIILAKELKADVVVLDDWLAREKAKSLDLNVVGTLGILTKAKEKGLIKNLKKYVDEMRKVGFWIADDVYERLMNLD